MAQLFPDSVSSVMYCLRRFRRIPDSRVAGTFPEKIRNRILLPDSGAVHSGFSDRVQLEVQALGSALLGVDDAQDLFPQQERCF